MRRPYKLCFIRPDGTQITRKQYFRDSDMALRSAENIAKRNKLKLEGIVEPYETTRQSHTVKIFWKDEEIEYLMIEYGKMPAKKLAEHLNRSEFSIRSKAHELGLMKLRPRWSDQEIDYLRKNYGKIPASEIADKLHRNIFPVRMKANRMGLYIYAKRPFEYALITADRQFYQSCLI